MVIAAVHKLGWQTLLYCCPMDMAKQQKEQVYASQNCSELPAAAPVVSHLHKGVKPRWGRERAQLYKHLKRGGRGGAGRRLQDRPHRYLDRASQEAERGALAAVPDMRLASSVRVDSESSSTSGDSPTSTIQLIVRRDS